MALLKDVRLLLIIATAILCLIALKMCSTEYATDVSSTNGVVTDAKTLASTDIDKETSEEGSEGEQNSQQSEADSAIAKVAEVATEKDAPEPIEPEPVEPEPVEPEPVEAEQVAKEQVTDTEEVDVEVAEADNAEENVTAENGNATDNTATAEAGAAAEVVAIDRTSADIQVEVKKIVFRDAANTGQDIPNLKADINSVKNGMRQYSEKAEVARTLLDKITGG